MDQIATKQLPIYLTKWINRYKIYKKYYIVGKFILFLKTSLGR